MLIITTKIFASGSRREMRTSWQDHDTYLDALNSKFSTYLLPNLKNTYMSENEIAMTPMIAPTAD